MKLTPEELYSLRKAQLVAQRKALEVQEAELCLREAMLEIERHYGLLMMQATLDIETGIFSFAPDEGQSELEVVS